MRPPSVWYSLLCACQAVCAEEQTRLGKGQLQQHGPSDSSSSSPPSFRSELLDLHRSLVEIESISGREYDVGSWLSEYLSSKGWTSTVQFVPPREGTPPGAQRMNVMAWPDDNDGTPDPKVLLTSHIDTVPPFIAYSIDEGEVTRDTRIYGRGSVDAKASVAAMIVAVDELLEKDEINPQDVMVLFVVGEEVSGDGMRWFNDSLDSFDRRPEFDAVIFGEPTESKLACGHKGGLVCHIEARGTAGHSGYPWLAKSANELIMRALVKVLDTDLGSSEQFGNTTINIGRLDGGVANNVIPARATAGIMGRVALGPQATGGEVVRKRLQAVLDEVDDEAFTLDCPQGYGLVETNCDVDGFDSIVVNYGTDIPHLEGEHTRYLYGPGTILVAHAANENITVGDLETAVVDYQKLVLNALGNYTA
ncbi:acetylornithine deacetylase [Geosmithia morbida]|uniref:Acetylornithine deacetylase n=1 Tax=Geosmithia morbida TaxID=1094350 RepID=A0A9P4Z2K4_9HYPO|nr:acetylornithine deacetylase [Geosmithia morbida]KAF4127017.1 acetylornithine deacetylase [Geosmithia morbida]